MHPTSDVWHIGPDRTLSLGQPRLIGILNVTPDSFHDGGNWHEPKAAADRALAMIEDGAAMIDVGGESTRPGATRVDASEQVERVVPVVERIRDVSNVAISVDTTRAAVARAALAAGANVINDVSAGTEEPELLDVVAEASAGVILMHRLVEPAEDTYSDRYETAPCYGGDVVAAVRRALTERVAAATEHGVQSDHIVIDPGLGFGKTVEQNYELVAGTARLAELGRPILAAASRKSFIGAASGAPDPGDRLPGSLALSVLQWQHGIRLFRVHDVAAHRQALAVAIAAAG